MINLKRSADRRAVMTERLDPLGLPYQFFEAVDGYALDTDSLPNYARKRRRLFFGRDLTQGEVGCLLSHRAVYQHMLNQNIESAIILEDDAILQKDFADVIRSVFSLPFKWDMVRFLDSEKVYRKSRPVVPLFGRYALIRTMIASGGAYAYILTKDAARVLLEHTQASDAPIDMIHGYVWKTGLEVFAVNPSPVRPDHIIASTIGHVRFDKTSQLSGWEKAAHPFARFWLKTSELVGKRMTYWKTWPKDSAQQTKR